VSVEGRRGAAGGRARAGGGARAGGAAAGRRGAIAVVGGPEGAEEATTAGALAEDGDFGGTPPAAGPVDAGGAGVDPGALLGALGAGEGGVVEGAEALVPVAGRRESGIVGPSTDDAGDRPAPVGGAATPGAGAGAPGAAGVAGAGGFAGADGSDGGAFAGFGGLCVGLLALMRGSSRWKGSS